VLSGGERARLTLARAFARPSNLLVLDEPTKDLDLETLDLLQEQLAEYPGTVLLVSHDRDFLDLVVTSTIATDGNGRWVEYAGGYTDMPAERAAGPRSAPPKTRNTKRSRPATQTSELPGSLPSRMNFSDRRALDLLPARIAALEARITELNAVLADLDLYRRDPARFSDTTNALAVTRDELAAAEDQWLGWKCCGKISKGSSQRRKNSSGSCGGDIKGRQGPATPRLMAGRRKHRMISIP
jgi:ABC transport system ATP-binding/permease protein